MSLMGENSARNTCMAVCTVAAFQAWPCSAAWVWTARTGVAACVIGEILPRGQGLQLLHADGRTALVEIPGLPFGLTAAAEYDEREFICEPGDSLMMFTDGAIEIEDAAGTMLGTEGLMGILTSLRAPGTGLRIEPLQKALLNFSNGIRLVDDLTLLELRFT